MTVGGTYVKAGLIILLAPPGIESAARGMR
jgi:hypothetical protein